MGVVWRPRRRAFLDEAPLYFFMQLVERKPETKLHFGRLANTWLFRTDVFAHSAGSIIVQSRDVFSGAQALSRSLQQ